MLPREFRILRAGWNDTQKGRFLFDSVAAQSVLAAYRMHGVDLMIDLEHLSLDTESSAYDPDARGWCKLEVRNGELWAVDVRWTPDGEARLSERRQRYVSPFFTFSTKTKRILAVYNIAICAIPATNDAPALVAASKKVGKHCATLSIEVSNMDDLKKLAALLGLGEEATFEEVYAAIKALMEDEGSEGDGGETETTADDADEKEGKGKEQEQASDDQDAEAASAMPPKLQAKYLAAVVGNAELKKRVERLEKDAQRSEVDRLLAEHTDKIPLALEPWAKKQTPEVLREYLKNAPSLPKVKTPPKQEGGASASGGEIELTDAEKEVAALSGVKPADLLAYKKKKAAAK